MCNMLALREANRRLTNFRDESSVICEHRKAMECRDCEDFLKLGIDAFEWLTRADRCFRLAVAEEPDEYDPKVERAIEQLFRGWLNPCDKANEWVEKVQNDGHQIDNLQHFKDCEAEVRAIVRHMDNDYLTAPMIELRDAAIEEHRNGETAEFV